jgi:hypothetical protein
VPSASGVSLTGVDLARAQVDPETRATQPRRRPTLRRRQLMRPTMRPTRPTRTLRLRPPGPLCQPITSSTRLVSAPSTRPISVLGSTRPISRLSITPYRRPLRPRRPWHLPRLEQPRSRHPPDRLRRCTSSSTCPARAAGRLVTGRPGARAPASASGPARSASTRRRGASDRSQHLCVDSTCESVPVRGWLARERIVHDQPVSRCERLELASLEHVLERASR